MPSEADFADDNEVSLEEMLSNFLTDDKLNDVSLQSTDVVMVQTTRSLVAARSKVFYGMLYGEFMEATSDVVPIDYTGTVLQAIVDYAITNTSEILDVATNENNPEPPYEMREVQTLVALVGASQFFQFPGLRKKAEERLYSALEAFP